MSRNLVLLVIDDSSPASSAYAGLVDLARVVTRYDDKATHISRWFQHCQSLFVEKELAFDLLSIDINFAKDPEDPISLSQGPAFAGLGTCSGLYHGMMALARRRSRNGDGGRIVLAWEIRTAFSEQFFKRAELRGDAIRGYGLLRAFIAQGEEGETLKMCLERELDKSLPGDDETDLFSVMEGDFERMPRTTPSGSDEVIPGLLPKWRRSFMQAALNRDVRVVEDDLRKQMSRLGASVRVARPGAAARRRNGNEEMDKRVTSVDLNVPVCDVEGQKPDRISVFSIMADVVGAGVLDLSCGLPEHRDVSVRQWLERLIGPTDPGVALERVKRLADILRPGADLATVHSTWVNAATLHAGPIRRGMMYCLLLARMSFERLDVDDAALLFNYGVLESAARYKKNTLTRNALSEAPILGCRKPKELRAALLQALQCGSAHADWRWLRAALRYYAIDVLGLPPSAVAVEKPGLAERSDEG